MEQNVRYVRRFAFLYGYCGWHICVIGFAGAPPQSLFMVMQCGYTLLPHNIAFLWMQSVAVACGRLSWPLFADK
jgi:hypothetical protein